MEGTLSEELDGVNVGPDYEPYGERIDFARPVRAGPTTRGFGLLLRRRRAQLPALRLHRERPRARRPDRPDACKQGPARGADDSAMGSLGGTADDYFPSRRVDRGKNRPSRTFHSSCTCPSLGRTLRSSPTPPTTGRVPQVPMATGFTKWTRSSERSLMLWKRTGALDDTIVVFSSDNGSPARSGIGAFGATRTVTELYSHVPNAPWRGLKADAWEAGHRVPFIVRWDGRVPPSTVSDRTVCLTDIFATVSEIVGFEMPDDSGEDSLSLAPLLPRKAILRANLNRSSQPGRALRNQEGGLEADSGRRQRRILVSPGHDPGTDGEPAPCSCTCCPRIPWSGETSPRPGPTGRRNCWRSFCGSAVPGAPARYRAIGSVRQGPPVGDAGHRQISGKLDPSGWTPNC